MVGSLTTGMFAIEVSNLLEGFFYLLNRQGVVLGFKSLGTAGSGKNHQELGLKLPERPGQLLRFGVLGYELKDRQIPFGVADNRWIILQLQQANIAMMILNGFHLELCAILRF